MIVATSPAPLTRSRYWASSASAVVSAVHQRATCGWASQASRAGRSDWVIGRSAIIFVTLQNWLRRTGIIEVVAYTLCALVARQPVGVVLQAETGLGAVELAQGFWLLPLGRSARLELGGRTGIEDLARHASLAGPVGYLEA